MKGKAFALCLLAVLASGCLNQSTVRPAWHTFVEEMHDGRPLYARKDTFVAQMQYDNEVVSLHPLSSFNVRNGIEDTVLTRKEISKSESRMREYEETEYCKAIWVWNSNEIVTPLEDFANRHNKTITSVSNHEGGKIRPGTVFRWSCKSCGFSKGSVYMNVLGLEYGKGTTDDFHVELTGFEDLTSPCPKCGK